MAFRDRTIRCQPPVFVIICVILFVFVAFLYVTNNNHPSQIAHFTKSKARFRGCVDGEDMSSRSRRRANNRRTTDRVTNDSAPIVGGSLIIPPGLEERIEETNKYELSDPCRKDYRNRILHIINFFEKDDHRTGYHIYGIRILTENEWLVVAISIP